VKLPQSNAYQQSGAVLEPQRLLSIQVASLLALALTIQLPSPSLGSQRVWEPPVLNQHLINDYRAPETAYGPGHRGVDYAVEYGQGVFAPADGLVEFVGKVVNRQVLTISHDGNLLSSYEPLCSSLPVGEQVFAGDLIGEVCEPEESYVFHCQSVHCLHFSARKNGEYLSPLWFTGELSASRLLPWVEPG
jgi:murein DD-endopeptidase MepM/ murein hydrolase activator NlpD